MLNGSAKNNNKSMLKLGDISNNLFIKVLLLWFQTSDDMSYFSLNLDCKKDSNSC